MITRWFSDLSLRHKLLLSFAVILSAIAAVSAIALWSAQQLAGNVVVLASQSLPRQIVVSDLAQRLQMYRILQYAHISALVPEDQVPIEKALKKVEADIPVLLGLLKSGATPASDADGAAELEKSWKAYSAYFNGDPADFKGFPGKHRGPQDGR